MKLSKLLSFRVSEKLYNRVRNEAFKFSKTVSQYLRDMMVFLIEDNLNPQTVLSRLHPPPSPIIKVEKELEWIEARRRHRRPSLKITNQNPYKESQKLVINELKNILLERGKII